MESFTFIHTSDLQLGMTRHFLDAEDAGPRFAQERIDVIERMGALAGETGAGCIVVAGDVFESNQLSEQVVARAVDTLRRLPVPVVLLPGNHDPLDAVSLYDTATVTASAERVVVVRDAQGFALPGLPGVEFVGAPWYSKRPTGDLCAAMLDALEPVRDGFRIALAHGQTSDQTPDPDAPGVIDLGRAEAAVRDGRVHYLALGDRHSMTAKGSTGAIWYSGTPVVTDFDEQAPGQVLVVTLSARAAPRVEPRQVSQWRFDEHHLEVADDDAVARIEQWMDTHAAPARTVAYLSLSGTVSLRTRARIDELLARATPRYASLRIHQRHHDLVVAPDSLDNDSLALSGYARSAWEELVAGARGSGEAARCDSDALALFYRLAGGEQ
jgi:DNA repair exonuclease SbcCD nuclease subunit